MTRKTHRKPAYDIFLSYSHRDKGLAERLSLALEQRGKRVFDSDDDIAPGQDWQKTFLAALKASDALIFIVPEVEGLGKFALQELGAAWALQKKIIPVLANSRRLNNSSLPFSMSEYQYLDASKLDEAALADRILSAA